MTGYQAKEALKTWSGQFWENLNQKPTAADEKLKMGYKTCVMV
jgi:hypothetical protein